LNVRQKDKMGELLNRLHELRLWQYLLGVGGAILVFFAIARLLSMKKQPTNTVAWLLAILLIPWVGVPMFLLFGGRKLSRLAVRKGHMNPRLPNFHSPHSTAAQSPTAQMIYRAGMGAPVGGNRIRFLTTGEQAFAQLEQQIRQARHSIHITTFILARDDTGRRLVRLLAQRAREGIRVRLLLDSVGSLFSSHGFCNPIRLAGGEVRRFMPVLPFTAGRSSANLRNHRKIAVFDQHTAIVGGHNIAREYMGPNHYRRRWRDFGALIQGPGATMLNEVFLADWAFASGETLNSLHNESIPEALRSEGEAEMHVVASGPDVPGDTLYEAIISMVQEAERSIWIVTPYFIPDEVLLRSLMVKARAGCEVVIIIPARSNHPITDFARRHYLQELKRAGAHIRLFGPGMLHSKGMIVDDRIGLMGSANFDQRSLFVNFEVGVLLYSQAEVLAMKSWAAELLSHCGPLRPRRHGLLAGRIAEDLSRLLAPLL